MRSPQKISGKVPRQSCWRWPEKRLDPSRLVSLAICVKSQKKNKWISDATYAAIREKREAKGRDKKRYQELKAQVQRKLRVDKQQQLEGMCMDQKQRTQKEIPGSSSR